MNPDRPSMPLCLSVGQSSERVQLMEWFDISIGHLLGRLAGAEPDDHGGPEDGPALRGLGGGQGERAGRGGRPAGNI